MKKAAVILAPGFEEGESLTIVDIIRRANLQCDIVGFSPVVEGAHQIEVQCDRVITELDPDNPEYDMVVLPGGMPGAANLRDSDLVMDILRGMDKEHHSIAAMCAAPIALERAGLLEGRNFTAYLGYDEKIKAGNYLTDIVVKDGNVITSRGPATAYAFAYALVDELGGDSLAVKNRMVYFNAFEEVK